MSPPPPPKWVVIVTKSSAEELAERAFRLCGYRVYLARYRKRLSPHGAQRSAVGSMRPLFRGIVFVQDWRGWPTMTVTGADRMMTIRPGVPAQLSDADVALVMARERALVFDEIVPSGSSLIRQDLDPGEEVSIDFHARIMGELEELTPDGRAIIGACLFNGTGRVNVDARLIHKI